jgi:5-methylcytosine-specific restriction endonuclease McrA
MQMTRKQRDAFVALITENQGYRCFYCNRALSLHGNTNRPTADHVLPLSKGGLDTISNIVACCKRCNQGKADFTADELRRMADKIDRALK